MHQFPTKNQNHTRSTAVYIFSGIHAGSTNHMEREKLDATRCCATGYGPQVTRGEPPRRMGRAEGKACRGEIIFRRALLPPRSVDSVYHGAFHKFAALYKPCGCFSLKSARWPPLFPRAWIRDLFDDCVSHRVAGHL